MEEEKKQILYVDYHYKKLILYVCSKILQKHPGVPLEPEDVYYEFLYTVPKVFKKFDESKGSLKTFILLCARGFIKNRCRYWNKKQHRVMNLVTSMEMEVADSKPFIVIEDQKFNKVIAELNMLERQIYRYYFLESMSCNKVAKLLNKSHHTIKKNIEVLKKKLQFFLSDEENHI